MPVFDCEIRETICEYGGNKAPLMSTLSTELFHVWSIRLPFFSIFGVLFTSSFLSSFLFGLHTISVTIPSARFNKEAAYVCTQLTETKKYHMNWWHSLMFCVLLPNHNCNRPKGLCWQLISFHQSTGQPKVNWKRTLIEHERWLDSKSSSLMNNANTLTLSAFDPSCMSEMKIPCPNSECFPSMIIIPRLGPTCTHTHTQCNTKAISNSHFVNSWNSESNSLFTHFLNAHSANIFIARMQMIELIKGNGKIGDSLNR